MQPSCRGVARKVRTIKEVLCVIICKGFVIWVVVKNVNIKGAYKCVHIVDKCAAIVKDFETSNVFNGKSGD